MTHKQENVIDLVEKASWVWRETLSVHRTSPETRIASSLSPIEIFVALYYGGVILFDPKNPFWSERDRCIISKGHGSICMYPILADLGFFPKEELSRVGKKGGFLGGIPDPIIPGYETVNGSLGHGLGVATGSALGIKRSGGMQNVFVVTGDGELHEGSNWEAIMFASHHKLDNLNLIVDDNQISMLGKTNNIVTHASLAVRLDAFGWDCVELDGHDVFAVQRELMKIKSKRNGRPKALIAKTKKGHGIPDLEGMDLAHVMNPSAAWMDSVLGNLND